MMILLQQVTEGQLIKKVQPAAAAIELAGNQGSKIDGIYKLRGIEPRASREYGMKRAFRLSCGLHVCWYFHF